MLTHALSPIAAAWPSVLPTASISGGLADFCTHLVTDMGLFGIFLLMLMDCACIPVPSEVTMLFAGFGVSNGTYSLPAVVIAGVLGNLAGSWISYVVGYYGPEELEHTRVGRMVFHERTMRRAHAWFDKYGAVSVLVSRLLPLVRTFISLPAGFARMPFGRFTLFTTLGCVPWVLALAAIGDAVGPDWKKWRNHLQYLDYAVLVAAVILIAVLVYRWYTRRAQSATETGR